MRRRRLLSSVLATCAITSTLFALPAAPVHAQTGQDLRAGTPEERAAEKAAREADQEDEAASRAEQQRFKAARRAAMGESGEADLADELDDVDHLDDLGDDLDHLDDLGDDLDYLDEQGSPLDAEGGSLGALDAEPSLDASPDLATDAIDADAEPLGADSLDVEVDADGVAQPSTDLYDDGNLDEDDAGGSHALDIYRAAERSLTTTGDLDPAFGGDVGGLLDLPGLDSADLDAGRGGAPAERDALDY